VRASNAPLAPIVPDVFRIFTDVPHVLSPIFLVLVKVFCVGFRGSFVAGSDVRLETGAVR